MSSSKKRNNLDSHARNTRQQIQDDSKELVLLMQEFPRDISSYIIEPFLEEERAILQTLDRPEEECPSTMFSHDFVYSGGLNRLLPEGKEQDNWLALARPNHGIKNSETLQLEHDWSIKNYDQWLFSLLNEIPTTVICDMKVYKSSPAIDKSYEFMSVDDPQDFYGIGRVNSSITEITFRYGREERESFDIRFDGWKESTNVVHLFQSFRSKNCHSRQTYGSHSIESHGKTSSIGVTSHLTAIQNIVNPAALGCHFYLGSVDLVAGPFARLYSADADWIWRFPTEVRLFKELQTKTRKIESTW